MKYRVTVLPALEITTETNEFLFETKEEGVAAANTVADMLLYLQDDLGVMEDYSNVVAIEKKTDGEWEQIDY